MKKKKNKKGNKIFVFAILIVLAVIGVFIFKDKLFSNKDTNKNNGNSVDKGKEVVPKVQIIDETSKTRPYAVMINNIKSARDYHSGLNDAYVVYEVIVEGGLTRLMAVFKDKDVARIGSVRSSRHYFLDYALEYDAIYTHFGWSPKAESDIKNLGVNNINGLYDAAFNRESNLPVAYEHTAFTSTEKIKSIVEKKGYSQTTNSGNVFKYSAKPIVIDSEDAFNTDIVDIEYSKGFNISFRYNSDKNLYYRFTNGVAHSDYISGEQFSTTNIIIMKVNNYNLDSTGRQEVDTVGTGTGYFVTNGKSRPITWSKSSRTAKTIYKYTDSKEVILNDGRTYVEVIPTNSTLLLDPFEVPATEE